ncbi:MAG: BTAD domain-containing putative transcriptional regulator [Blastocatellia bacterium]|nr:BTAD domain-containing putative transcriptional regulator [Blastocatellia bacterium]
MVPADSKFVHENRGKSSQPSGEEAGGGASQFEEIASLLRETRARCEGADDEPLAYMLEAAYGICRACSCAWSDVEQYRRAYCIAQERQAQLLGELAALIRLIHVLPTRQGAKTISAGAAYEPLLRQIIDRLQPLPAGPESGDDSAASDANCAPPPASLADITFAELPEPPAVSPPPLVAEPDSGGVSRPSLAVYFLSPFRVLLDEEPVAGWPNCKGKSIFKYLVTHRERPISKEVLMEIFWPEGDPDSARNNLNVAIYGLRKSLTRANVDYSYVLFQDGCYLLNPELEIWVDTEAFMKHVRKAKDLERRGDLSAAIHEYRTAEAIYQSEFLVEDRYEEWLVGARQNFHNTYLTVMNRLSNYYLEQQDYEACLAICTRTLAHDACNEEVHQRLMRCYSLMGHAHLAMRQYHLCRESLARDLNLKPSRETMQLFEQIRQRQSL